MRGLKATIGAAIVNNRFWESRSHKIGNVGGYGFGINAKGIPASYLYRNKKNFKTK